MKIKYKRLVAFIIDIFLVSFVSVLISNTNLITSQMDKYYDSNNRLEEKLTSIIENMTIEKEDEEDIKALIYDNNSFGLVFNLIDIILTVGYFGIFQFFNKGQTIGKKLLKIKVVAKDDKNLSLINFVFRTIILQGTLFTVINMIGLQFLKINGYYNLYTISNSINYIIEIVLLFMILFRKDERGLHDILASSKVIEE